jgi:hypothetical protein
MSPVRTLSTFATSWGSRSRCRFVTRSFLSLAALSFAALLFVFPAHSIAQNASQEEVSRLWGEGGELWNPQGRLPDFSRAGYHQGNDPIPRPPVQWNVKNFGAKGDGVTDDTQAFKNAIAKGGVISIPAGRYKITRRLHITKSNTVLRGAGQSKTTLYFPKHLTAAEGRSDCATYGGKPTSCYSFREGFLSAKGSLREIGIEDLTVAFPPTGYLGHHRELGYNGIHFEGVTNSWVRHVTITNFDFGLILYTNTAYTTVQDLTLSGRGGHHGFSALRAHHNLFIDFRIQNTSIHDITVSDDAHHNVFANGAGVDINLDHHGNNPHDNLFSNINMGKGARPWRSSGGVVSAKGGHSGPRETLWNIRKGDGSPFNVIPGFGDPRGPVASQVNVIGFAFSQFNKTSANEWIEGIAPANLFPEDLYFGQLARRLGDPLDNGDDDEGDNDDPVTEPSGLPIRSVTASSVQSPNVATNTRDSDMSTRWSAEGDGQWIAYDLGTPRTVSQVAIAWYQGNQRQASFAIEVSSNGANWTEVHSGNSRGRTLSLEPYDFTAVSARYVRILGYGNTVNSWNSITEVEISGAGN